MSQGLATPRPPASWRDWWPATRDRLLASPRFQRWAGAFPLTRPIARRHARAVFDLCAGFVYSQVLFACIQLRVFERLRDGPESLDTLASATRLPLDGARTLLDAAVSLKLLERRDGGRYGLGPLGAATLGNAGIAAMVEHHDVLYGDLHDPIALLRGEVKDTALSRYWAYARSAAPSQLGADDVAEYSRLMATSQSLVAEEILDAYPIGQHRCVLDVGGGEGVFLLSAARRAPDLRCMLFDLPAVAERARARFAQAGVPGQAFGGDFRRDALPRGADVVSFVRVLHDHGDDTVRILLRSAFEALPPGGTLLVAEPMARTGGAEPMGEAYFGFYLTAMGSGRSRSTDELHSMVTEAGFRNIRTPRTRQPLQTGVLVARRP